MTGLVEWKETLGLTFRSDHTGLTPDLLKAVPRNRLGQWNMPQSNQEANYFLLMEDGMSGLAS